MNDFRIPIRLGGRILALTVLTVVLAACNEEGTSSPATSPAAASATVPSTTTPSSAAPAAAGNQAPTITGTPPSAIAVNQTFSFRPSATDPNGDTLTFQIQNKPDWATFSTTDGGLQGTPSVGHVGTYSGIVIAVSDGASTKAMNAFAINVTQIATGSASVSWTPPTQNVDGSALTNLAGYRIYYGKSQNDLNQLVTINSVGLATYIVENLSPSTWYFAVKAFTTNGVESDFSSMASKVIR